MDAISDLTSTINPRGARFGVLCHGNRVSLVEVMIPVRQSRQRESFRAYRWMWWRQRCT